MVGRVVGEWGLAWWLGGWWLSWPTSRLDGPGCPCNAWNTWQPWKPLATVIEVLDMGMDFEMHVVIAHPLLSIPVHFEPVLIKNLSNPSRMDPKT